jgi:hypothetical protein
LAEDEEECWGDPDYCEASVEVAEVWEGGGFFYIEWDVELFQSESVVVGSS